MASAHLSWLLTDLAARVPEIEQVVALSRDGLAVASAASLGAAEVQRLAAIAASALSTARAVAEYSGAEQVRQVMLDMAGKYLFIAACGKDGCLALVTSGSADIGLVAYEMALCAERVGDRLTTARTALGTSDGVRDRHPVYEGPLLVASMDNPQAEIGEMSS